MVPIQIFNYLTNALLHSLQNNLVIDNTVDYGIIIVLRLFSLLVNITIT